MQETGVPSLGGEDPLEEESESLSPVRLFGTPWNTVHGILINGNPLQYSCLENPMDRATFHGVAELDTTERPNNSFSVPHSASGTLLPWVTKP